MRSTASERAARYDVSEQLRAARDLLGQGRAGEAQLVIDAVLAACAQLPREALSGCCGVQARLLALRGERVRAAMMAELAVWLARDGAPGRCQADAYLDQACTLRALGDRDEARACLRRARELAPLDVPA